MKGKRTRTRNERIDALADNGIYIILKYGPAGVGGWYAKDIRRRRLAYGGRRDDAISLGEGMLQTRDMALPKRITPLSEGIDIAQAMIDADTPPAPTIPEGHHLAITEDDEVWFAYGAGCGPVVRFGRLAAPDADGHRDLPNPTPEFWQAWRNNGHQVRSLCGFRADKVRGRWHVWWHSRNGLGVINKAETVPEPEDDESPLWGESSSPYPPDEGAFATPVDEPFCEYQAWLDSLSLADFIEAVCERELAGRGSGTTSADSDYHAYLKRNGGS